MRQQTDKSGINSQAYCDLGSLYHLSQPHRCTFLRSLWLLSLHIYHFGEQKLDGIVNSTVRQHSTISNKKIDIIFKFGEQLTPPITIHFNSQSIDPMNCIRTDNSLKLTQSSCIGRESNPGRPRGRRAFYHWTTDANKEAFARILTSDHGLFILNQWPRSK